MVHTEQKNASPVIPDDAIFQNYLYAGVQYGQECFCGNTYGSYGTSTECKIPCSGDPSLGSMCGGDWSNTVMHTGVCKHDSI